MSEPNDRRKRILALCATCRSIYAAHELLDGTILPIGRNGCSCDEQAFEKIELASSPEHDEADPTGEAD